MLTLVAFFTFAVPQLPSPTSEPALPILSASSFHVGQEFIWVSETSKTILTFGGQTKTSSSRSVIREKIIEIDDEPKARPDYMKYINSLHGDPSAIELERRKSHIASGTFRIAEWFSADGEEYKPEPDIVYWMHNEAGMMRSEAALAGDLGCFFYRDDEHMLPSFSFAPLALIGVAKPGDTTSIGVGVNFEDTLKVRATAFRNIDGYKCLEIECGTNTQVLHRVYYRLSDGLIQRFETFSTDDHEFKVDGILGKGHTTYSGYRLDKMPPKQ
jgi:hypothetical protein